MKNIVHVLALSVAAVTVLGASAAPASAQVYGGVTVRFGPPAPIYEQAPPRPGPGYAWHAGYWQWNGNRYVWNHGYYMHRPQGYQAWIPGHWIATPHGYVWREGHWT